MMTNTELKPCPFCGHLPAMYEDWHSATALNIECMNEGCPAKPSTWGATKEAAIERWNTRVSDDEIARLRAELLDAETREREYAQALLAAEAKLEEYQK